MENMLLYIEVGEATFREWQPFLQLWQVRWDESLEPLLDVT